MASKASITQTIRDTTGISVSLESRRISLAIEGLVMVKNIKSARSKPGSMRNTAQPYSGCFFINAVFVRIKASRLAENRIGNAHFADVVQERGNFQVLQFGFLKT